MNTFVFDSARYVPGSRWRWMMAGLLLAAVAAAGCSQRSAAESDQPAAGQTSARMSPEQCMAGAEIDEAAATSTASESQYLIQPGDVLGVDFYLSPEFDQQVTVRPDGMITMREVGDVKAWGLTPDQLAKELDHAYLSELRNPGVVVRVKNTPSRLVYVEGQVNKPGSFPLEPGMTAVEAISEAGGPTDQAGGKAVVIRRDLCGQPTGIRFDLDKATKNPEKGGDIALLSRDVVVVPRSGIANVDLFVKQYIQGLIPIPPYATIPF
ncbi:MAG TPA: polysaccharide biosynthesis/export family protein [Candidatus Binataceae bacterium]|jgi:protein involved in polysaccharide export with SLBB domain|nr:polysaccharide biosynthesis/export family protein [Candidatus Binataceae bacterium]